MEKTILYNLCKIQDGSGKLLVQKRLRGLRGHTFPGGKIRADESIEDSVVREVREETGLMINNPIYKTTVSFYDSSCRERRQIFLFEATSFCGDLITKNDEGLYFWKSIDEFLKLDLVDGMEEFLRAFSGNRIEWHYNT